MAKDENKANESTENVEQTQSTENTTDNMVPSYRLREEADKRRTIQAELDEFKKEKTDRENADLSAVEKLTKANTTLTEKVTSLETTAVRKELDGQFTTKVVEAGLPTKIAKIAVPSNLSEDNMKDSVKNAIKEFSEFITKTDDKKEDTPISAAASLLAATQPAQQVVKDRTYEYPGQFTAKEAAEKLMKQTKEK
jgi:hypothetical protein